MIGDRDDDSHEIIMNTLKTWSKGDVKQNHPLLVRIVGIMTFPEWHKFDFPNICEWDASCHSRFWMNVLGMCEKYFHEIYFIMLIDRYFVKYGQDYLNRKFTTSKSSCEQQFYQQVIKS